MNAIEQLENVTGFKRPEIDKIFQEVKANSALLDACSKPHDFSICIDRRTKQVLDNPTPAQRFGAKWKCSKCGGVVDGLRKISYCDGLKDANL